MGVILEVVALVLLIFASIKLGWPWSIVMWVGYLLLFSTKHTPISKRIASLNPRLGYWTAAFVGAWLFLGGLFTRAFENAGVTSEFLFGGTALPVFWGFLTALIITGGVFLLVLIMPMAFVVSRGMYGKHGQEAGQVQRATKNAVGLTLGVNQGNWEVKNGQVMSIDQGKGKVTRVGGPGQLTVQQGYAVILEKDGMVTRVVGRGINWLEPMETISMVVALFTRMEQLRVNQVLTRDHVLINEIEVFVFHKADPGDEHRRVSDGSSYYDPAVLMGKIWSGAGKDWRDTVKAISDRAVREVVGRHDLERLVPLSGSERENFNDAVKEQINKITKSFLGIEVSAVDTGLITIPTEVQQRLLERWLADWDKDVISIRAETEKQALVMKAAARKDTMQLISQGLKNTMEANKDAESLIALRFIEYLENRDGSQGDPASDGTDALIKLQGLQALRSFGMPANGHAGK